jgi:hypothetical protein
MKRFVVLLMAIMSMFLSSCAPELVNEKYGYKLYKESYSACSTMIEEIEVSNDYLYYFPCLESQYYVLEDEEGKEYNFNDFMLYSDLTIEEVFDLFDGIIHRMELSVEERIQYHLENLEVENVQLRYENANVTIYQYDFVNPSENAITYMYRDIAFYSDSSEEASFMSFGYIGVYNGIIKPLEELVEMDLITEIELVNFIDTLDYDSEISEISKISIDPASYPGILVMYYYQEESIYHQSISTILTEFFANDNVIGYTLIGPNEDKNGQRQYIPFMNIYVDSNTIIRLYGSQIVDFVMAFEDFDEVKQDTRDMFADVQYTSRIGHINDYNIVFYVTSPTMYASYAFEYEGYWFYNYSQWIGQDEFSNIGYYAEKDNQLYKISVLLENGDISLQDLLRVFPFVTTEHPFEVSNNE